MSHSEFSYLPSLDRFAELARDADYVPVYRQLVSDALTPVQALGKIDQGVSSCLFESVIGGEKVGRYSFLASEPFLLLEAHDREVSIARQDNRNGSWERETFESSNPLDILREHVHSVRVIHLDELPPFVGGAIGYAGYDTVRYVEHLPNAPKDDRGLPDLAFAFYDHMIVFDHVQKTIIVLALADVRSAVLQRNTRGQTQRSTQGPVCCVAARLQQAYQRACDRVDALVEKLDAPADAIHLADISTSGSTELKYTSNLTKQAFEDAVKKCVEYIRAGDIFQVVISQRLEVPLRASPLELYRTLRVVNPSPFMFYLRTPDVTLVGSSPEIMVRVVDGQITVRPLAGTRRRGATEEEDLRLAEELLADPKERAEHVMLVDLGRNDVGRVAKYGTVELSDEMVIERYSHVMHITSNVTGQLTDEHDAFDALAACLPAGTVSGAPKVRAMEIIDEIEPHRRGPYAGAVGYLDFAGNMDTCIALRTIVVQNGTAYVQAGAGIVADSVPEAEYEETLNKARGLLKAIEITEQRVG